MQILYPSSRVGTILDRNPTYYRFQYSDGFTAAHTSEMGSFAMPAGRALKIEGFTLLIQALVLASPSVDFWFYLYETNDGNNYDILYQELSVSTMGQKAGGSFQQPVTIPAGGTVNYWIEATTATTDNIIGRLNVFGMEYDE